MVWIIDKILQAWDSRNKVKVLVHEACFSNDTNREPHYFVKITNCSPNNPITLTHAWVKDHTKEIEILNAERPLPHKLKPTDTWETWFRKDIIKNQDNIFNNVYVVLSDGKKYRSKRNKTVRPAGYVA